MNENIIKGSWTETKGKIKAQWAKLNDNDIDELNGNLEQLAGKIQKVYGYGVDQAKNEYESFKKTLSEKIK